MREQFEQNLRAVFGGSNAVVVSDSEQLVDWLTDQDIEATTFAQLAVDGRELSQMLAVPLDYDNIPSRADLRKIFANTSVLWIPQASFSSDPDIGKYSVEMFASSDIAGAVAKNRWVISEFLMADQSVTLHGPDTELRVQLPEALQLLGRTRLELLPDEHSALGNYFEVAMSPLDLADQMDTDLQASGTFRIDSIVAARHREFRGTATTAEIASIVDEMWQASPFQITIRDSRIVSGLERWADRLQVMVGPIDTSALTEVAIGTGVMPLDKVDWSLNTVVNEGATGVHIGIGNGLNGVHFDFISTEAQLSGI